MNDCSKINIEIVKEYQLMDKQKMTGSLKFSSIDSTRNESPLIL